MGKYPENPVEVWTREHVGIVKVDSVTQTYSDAGPPSWRKPWPEIERDLDPSVSADWAYMVCIMELCHSLPSGAVVLDIGYGPGWPTVALSRYVSEIVAVDASELAVSLLRDALGRRGIENVNMSRADAEVLPFREDSFDAVVSSELLGVVDRPIDVVKEMLRVLRPNGRMVSWVQNFRRILAPHDHVCQRSISPREGGVEYKYLYSALDPPHHLSITFQVDVTHPATRDVDLSEGTSDRTNASVVEELSSLRAALLGKATLYRNHEFTPETAAQLLCRAGFVGVSVSPLSADICRLFAEALAERRAARLDAKQFAACAAGLARVMPHTGFDTAWQMTIKGTKPSGQMGEREPNRTIGGN